MSKFQNKSTGKIGEDLACEFLIKNDYKILERNWGNKWGEIDIIAKDKEIIVFVEVKTKIGVNFGTPEEMINTHKINQIQRLASTYPQSQNAQLRIDVIAVILNSDYSLQSLSHHQAVY